MLNLPVASITLSFDFWVMLIAINLACLARLMLRAVTVGPFQSRFFKYPDEKYYNDASSSKVKNYQPSLSITSSTIDLTVIIPCSNDEKRLPMIIEDTIAYLEAKKSLNEAFKYEIIIVDDASQDSTCNIALEYSKIFTTDLVRVLKFEKSRGKGDAMRIGVLKSRGRFILFADADDLPKYSDYEQFENGIKNNSINIEADDVAVYSSRRYLEKVSLVEYSLFGCLKQVRDTQFGFKLFTRTAALKLFSNLHNDKWAFSTELFYIASRLNVKIFEINISNVSTSLQANTLHLIKLFINTLITRLYYAIGVWKLSDNYFGLEVQQQQRQIDFVQLHEFSLDLD